MAEALFIKLIQEVKSLSHLQVESAGIFADEGLGASREAIEILRKKENLDLNNHQSQRVSLTMVEDASLIICMTKRHKEFVLKKYPVRANKIFTLCEYANDSDEDIIDPIGLGKKAYQEATEQIKILLGKMIIRILSEKNL